MSFIYQNYATYFAQCPEELKPLASLELKELGILKTKDAHSGFYFEVNFQQLYHITYNCRIINRILAPLANFKVFSTNTLYKCIYKMEWEKIIRLEDTFTIFANVSNSPIKHSQYAMLCMKDAIVDRFRDKYNQRPSVERQNPDIVLNLFINRDKATINLDIGGGSLHKRGYRKASVTAPIQENIAAAFIKLAKWDGQHPLYDMFCGSGTIAFEATMHYCKIPSAYFRKNFGFFYLPEFDQNTWQKVKNKSNQKIRPLPKDLIFASDNNSKAIKAINQNKQVFETFGNISVKQQNYQDIKQIKNSCIITNPPYGIRLKINQDEQEFAKQLGDFLKQRCTGSNAFIYFGKREMIKYVGLRTKNKHIIKSGGLDGRLAVYELY